jgi:hypothetical protein
MKYNNQNNKNGFKHRTETYRAHSLTTPCFKKTRRLMNHMNSKQMNNLKHLNKPVKHVNPDEWIYEKMSSNIRFDEKPYKNIRRMISKDVWRFIKIFDFGYDIENPEIKGFAANRKTVKQLLRKGVNINSNDEFGMTALNYAIIRRNSEVSEFLIQHGADISIGINKTIEHLIWEHKTLGKKYDETIEPLIYHGAVTTRTERCIVEAQQRAMVLCLFKILYHKFIFLDVNSMFDLVQTLLLDIVPEEMIIYIMFYNNINHLFDINDIYNINDLFDINDIYNIINY